MSSVNGTKALQAEESLLGAVLLTNRIPDDMLRAGLQPDHFYRQTYAAVFRAMLALHERGVGVDVELIVAELDRDGELDQVGGRAGLEMLTGAVPFVGNAAEYARTVVEAAQRRRELRAIEEYREQPSPERRQELAKILTTPVGPTRRRVCSVSDYLAKPRAPLDPYITANEGRTVMLAAGTAMLIGGPSGIGKSVTGIDACGLLASDNGGDWLGCSVTGRRRVLLISLEGSDEDTVDRLAAIVPTDAHSRFFIDDRWASGRTVPTLEDVAASVREYKADVVCVDTGAAWMQDRHDISRGIPEEAYADLETVRRLADRDVAFLIPVHTRKRDRSAGNVDELEELAGTFGKKADSAVVIRRDGDGPRRKITFAKTRRGPEPPAIIATLPDADCDEPPRLRVIAEAKPRLKEGTEAERIAEWIARQPEPQTVSAITAALDLSEDTLRRRRSELEGLDIRYARVPGGRTTRAYGTPEQWRRAHGLIPEVES